MAVSRCVCKNVPFSSIQSMSRGGHATLEEVTQRTGCGTGCGMCIPYVRVVLLTGLTQVPVLNASQLARVLDGTLSLPGSRTLQSH